jgi:hypothetical protein
VVVRVGQLMPNSLSHKGLELMGRAAFAVSPYPTTTYDKKNIFSRMVLDRDDIKGRMIEVRLITLT